ncbi:Small glutamine-rich tetratricopeptide repeat-containing protein alpha [Nymphon striatum]|nr:Small glutamine-rich tetratricopeptide repeat-containing protein alpha [Nymphon striatum]
MSRPTEKKLVYSFIKFLQSEIQSASLSADAKESLEVAIQCLESTYAIDGEVKDELEVSSSLINIFSTAIDTTPVSDGLNEFYGRIASAERGLTINDDKTKCMVISKTPQKPKCHIKVGNIKIKETESFSYLGSLVTSDGKCKKEPPLTEEMKKEAEELKMRGNTAMKTENYAEAVSHYDKAIEIDSSNAVFYSNRQVYLAAAHNKLNNHDAAIVDCMKAITIDPTYSKAYGRMGLAFASKNNHVEARNCYQKAVDIDPENASYQGNLKIAEEKLKETPSNRPANVPSGDAGGLNFANFFNNAAFMNVAQNLMSDPRMQNLISSVISSDSMSGQSGVEGLLQVGQQLASEMNTTNPEMMEQLRQQMENAGGQDSQPKPDDPNKQT